MDTAPWLLQCAGTAQRATSRINLRFAMCRPMHSMVRSFNCPAAPPLPAAGAYVSSQPPQYQPAYQVGQPTKGPACAQLAQAVHSTAALAGS